MRCMSWSRRSASTRTVAAARPASPRSPATTGTGDAGPPARRRRPRRASATSADLGGGDVGHRGQGGAQRDGLDLARRPTRRRGGRRRPRRASSAGAEATTRAELGQRRRGPCRPAPPASSVSSASVTRDVQHAWPVPTASATACGTGGGRGTAVACDVLIGRAVADEALQALDERRGLEALGAVGVDRVDGGLERVEALEQDVDRLARQAARALAQQLEDVLHLVGEGGHARRSPWSRSCPSASARCGRSRRRSRGRRAAPRCARRRG